MRDFTIRSNTNELGLRSNVIKDLCPLILHQLITGWISKAHGPIVTICIELHHFASLETTLKIIFIYV